MLYSETDRVKQSPPITEQCGPFLHRMLIQVKPMLAHQLRLTAADARDTRDRADPSRMVVFHFKVYRDGAGVCEATSGDFPDCGMAFRAARTMIQRIRSEENLPETALDGMRLEVTYDDGSELFRLPFTLGI